MAKNHTNTAPRPAAGMTAQPRTTRRDAEQDDPEPAKRPQKADRVGDFFDKAPYFGDYQFLCLKQIIRGATYYLSVSRFYPEQNVAVDLFYSAHEYAAGNTEFKAAALKKEGVKYVFLAPGVQGHSKVDTLAEQIAVQEK